MTRSHTLAEWFAIQTGRGLVYRTPQGQLVKKNLSPLDAAKEIRGLVANLTFRDLTAEEVLASTEQAANVSGIKGNSFHDFLHVRAAEIHRAKSIVTLNFGDYARMTQLPLEAPRKGM